MRTESMFGYNKRLVEGDFIIDVDYNSSTNISYSGDLEAEKKYTMLTGMNGLRAPAIATGTEVPYKTRVSSDTTSPVATLSNDLDERLSDFTFLLRQILDLLERAKLGVDNDELAAALAFALRGESRGFGGA